MRSDNNITKIIGKRDAPVTVGVVTGTSLRTTTGIGCWLARRLHQLKASTTMDLGISILCTILCGLEKLGPDDQNWLERNSSALLLRTLVVGRRQPSESIEAALDME